MITSLILIVIMDTTIMVVNFELSFEFQSTFFASNLLFSEVTFIVPDEAVFTGCDIIALQAIISSYSPQPPRIVLISLPSFRMAKFVMISKKLCMFIHSIAKVAHVPIVHFLAGHDSIVLMIDMLYQKLLDGIPFRFFALFFAEFAPVNKFF